PTVPPRSWMQRSLSRRTCAVAISPDLLPRGQRADEHESPWRCWRTCARWPIALARTLNSPARLHPGGPLLRTIHAAVAHGWRARKFRRQESRPPRGNAGSPPRSDLLPRPRRPAVLPAPELDNPACSTRQRRRAANRAKVYLHSWRAHVTRNPRPGEKDFDCKWSARENIRGEFAEFGA